MFTQNLIDYYKTGTPGKCITCGNNLTIEIIKTSIRNNCVIRCEFCEKEEIFVGTTNGEV